MKNEPPWTPRTYTVVASRAAASSGQTSPRDARRSVRAPPPPPRPVRASRTPRGRRSPEADLIEGNIFAGAADAASPRTRRRACFARSRPAPSPPPRASARESPRSSASISSTAVREDAPRTRHRRRCASRAPRMRGARSSAYKTGTADRLETTNRRDAGPAPDETRDFMILLLRLDGFPSDADARAGQPSRRPKNHVVYGFAPSGSSLRFRVSRDERAKHARSTRLRRV